MTTDQPTSRQGAPPTYWQSPSTGPDDQVLAGLRVRLVALVAALVVQATIAILGVLPDLPGARALINESAPYYYSGQTVNFWIQYAVLEFIAAVVVSFAFGPGVNFRDLPVIGRLVLGFGFVVLPAAAIVLGAFDAAQAAGALSPAAAASTWLTNAFFGALFFGLPLIAMARQGSPAASTRT